jgi:hypothetical protein
LSEAADQRAAASSALALELALTDPAPPLATIANHVPNPHRSTLLDARARLTALTAELAEVQARNANLIGHLRSYLRGVISELTATGAPQRYGPSGSRVAPATGVAVQTRG